MPTPHYGQPRYRAIARELRERIETGAIPLGALLPAESALAAEFRASRGTIRQAIAVLRQDRVVSTEHGRGTYVMLPRRRIIADEGIEADTRQREVEADSELASLFSINVGSALIEHQRVKRVKGVVREVQRTYRPLQTEQ
ncbi:GntR family transcriptional regulator [Micromonospora chalcea]